MNEIKRARVTGNETYPPVRLRRKEWDEKPREKTPKEKEEERIKEKKEEEERDNEEKNKKDKKKTLKEIQELIKIKKYKM